MSPRCNVRMTLSVLVAVLLLAVGCSSSPQAVLRVPPGGAYTFGPQLMVNGGELKYGWAGGTVTVCAEEELALSIEVSGWSEVNVWLSLGGVTQGADNWWTTAPYVTTPVGPGCGTLSVQPYTLHFELPPSLTVSVTEA